MEQHPARPHPAIITGAASGMGAAAAAQFAAQGWSLILNDLHGDRLEAVAAPLRATGTPVDLVAGDVSDPAFPDRLLAALGDRAVGGVVHSAGVSPTQGDAARMYAVNYEASERLVDALRPRMAEGACAVLISSSSGYLMKAPAMDAAIAALVPGGGTAGLLALTPESGPAYALSKRALMKLVARQAGPFGAHKARIMSIAPGLIDTPMGRAEQAGNPNMDAMLAKVPLSRHGVADEIAAVALFLCSPAASYVSGIDILVDGGLLAAMGGL